MTRGVGMGGGGGGSTFERRFKHIKKLTFFADPPYTPYFFDFREGGGGSSHISGEGGGGYSQKPNAAKNVHNFA